MMMPQGAPPGLQALLGGGQPDQGGASQDGGLSCLQDVIQGFPKLLHELSDPADVRDATKALAVLTSVQHRLMTSQGASSGPSTQSG